jgi:hypothetical protein
MNDAVSYLLQSTIAMRGQLVDVAIDIQLRYWNIQSGYLGQQTTWSRTVQASTVRPLNTHLLETHTHDSPGALWYILHM